MAHQWMRANLASAVFPFFKDAFARTIIIPSLDQNYDRATVSSADADKDRGIPQAFYMHNCVPTGQGYQATGYDTVVAAMAGNPDDFNDAFPLIDPLNDKFIFSPAVGKNYLYSAVLGAWQSISPIAPGILRDDIQVTIAYIQGQTYIYYANYGCFTYSAATNTMVPVVLTGLVAAAITGITAANGYMIAWNDTTVVWSSAVTPTDFVPSLITGAGGGSVNDVKGRIVTCLQLSGGFVVYCEQNSVAAKYSGNIRFPFIFSEITGSGGVSSPEQVSWQGNFAEHYVWSTAGMQKIDKTGATVMAPELTDFLANRIFEDFDEATLLFSVTYLSTPLNIKIAAVGERWLILSYGTTYPNYTHALVWDLALKRWGKFKIQHRDCFAWNAPNLFGIVTYGMLGTATYGDFGTTTYGDLLTRVITPTIPKKTIAFLQADGTVQLVNFDLAQTDASGVIVIGKFQLQRNKYIVHQNTDIESIRDSNLFDAYLLPTLDGKTFLPAVPLLENSYKTQGPMSRRTSLRLTGCNVSHLFIGAFNLTSLIIDFTIGGDR